MKISPAVRRETSRVAVGVLIGDGVMFLVFALLHRLDLAVILGGLIGSVTAIGNFFVMGCSLQKALEYPEKTKAMVQKSYSVRMLVMIAVLAIAIWMPWADPIAVAIPYLMPSVVLKLLALFGVYRREEANHEA